MHSFTGGDPQTFTGAKRTAAQQSPAPLRTGARNHDTVTQNDPSRLVPYTDFQLLVYNTGFGRKFLKGRRVIQRRKARV